jgi:PAS domain S-box-containing protein
MKIKQKIVLSYLVISLLWVIAGGIGIITTEQVNRNFEQIANQTIPVKNELDILENSINDIVRCTLEYVLLKENSILEPANLSDNVIDNRTDQLAQINRGMIKESREIDKSKHVYLKSIRNYQSLVKSYFPDENNYVEAIQNTSHEVIEKSRQFILASQQQKSRSLIYEQQQEFDRIRKKFDAAIQLATNHEHDELTTRQAKMHSTLQYAVESILGVSLANIILAIILGTLVSFSISKPLQKLQVAAQAIGQGHLGIRANLSTKDELGALARAFDKMAADLQQYIHDLQQEQESRSLLAMALENVGDAIEITDAVGHYIYVNPAFERITGYSQSDVLGQTPAALLRNEQQSTGFYQDMAATVARKNIWHGFYVSKHKDGTLYDQELTLSPIVNEQDQVTHVVAVKRDITDRKRSEVALQKSEERLRLVLQGSNDGFWDWDVATNEVFYSSRWKAMRGFSNDEISSKLQECVDRIHPEDVNLFQQALQAHMERRTDTFSVEYRSRCQDGSYIWILDRGQACWDSAGNCMRMVGSETDITRLKTIEATLREAERRWLNLLDNVQLVVVGIDLVGRVEYVNAFFLELSGYRREEVIGKNWFENFLPQQQQRQTQQYFLDIQAQNLDTYSQNQILTKSGEEKMIAWNNTFLKTPQGEIIGMMSIGADITERQAIERMKDEFISVVSHELRTPLASIQGALSLLMSGLLDLQPDKVNRIIEIASESVDHLVIIISDILELEKLNSDQMRLSKQLCNAAQLMPKVENLIQVNASRVGITVAVTPREIFFAADPDRILQVLTNLLSNAIKFSEPGSTVWLTVELQNAGEDVVFEVKDRGRGIPVDNLDRIFQRFQQVEASDSRQKGGTGLGLAICRSIVEQHGGRIWVESILGKGSSFFFSLPTQIAEDRDQKT